MSTQEGDVEEIHLRKPIFLGFERCGDDVFQTVVSHEMAHERGDNGPKHVGLEIFLEKPTDGAAGLVFFLREGEGPRMNVRVLFHDVWVSVVLHVVLFSPVIHRKARKKRESQRCKCDVACFGFTCRGMNTFVANHGDGGGDQPGQRKKDQSPFEREHDMCCVQKSNHHHQCDEFGP